MRVCLHVTEKPEDDTKETHLTDPLPAANNVEEALQPVRRQSCDSEKEREDRRTAKKNWCGGTSNTDISGSDNYLFLN
jgi:hypothetical protein